MQYACEGMNEDAYSINKLHSKVALRQSTELQSVQHSEPKEMSHVVQTSKSKPLLNLEKLSESYIEASYLTEEFQRRTGNRTTTKDRDGNR